MNPLLDAHPLSGDIWPTDRAVLCTMEHMYDHFYKVLWKLLVKARYQAGGAAKEP